MASDRYESQYARKLWELLPAIYRAEDPPAWDRKGPLQEIVDRLGAQIAVVRRSIDRLWEDQAIESCDDEMIEHIGALVATRMVESLDARASRLDVAKTIYYRRRKGTQPLLEELAADITGWEVRVVEMFHRLARTRHLLDPAIGMPALAGTTASELQIVQKLVAPRTRTPAGGTADLRDDHGARHAKYSAFDEYNHTLDVRRGRGATGWHDIPHIGVFVWRLHSVPVAAVDTIRATTACTNQVTFDPTGRDVPLFALREEGASAAAWSAARDYEVPGPISSTLAAVAFEQLYPQSMEVHRFASGTWSPVSASDIARRPADLTPGWKLWIDPERGRIVLPVPPVAGFEGPFRVDNCCALVSEIGAGAYERRQTARRQRSTTPPTRVSGGALALAAPLLALAGAGEVAIADSLTYTSAPSLASVAKLRIAADNKRRPLLRLTQQWRIEGRDADAELVLDGLWLAGAHLELAGTFKRVSIRCCTIDPGSWAGTWRTSADGRTLQPSRVLVTGTISTLEIDRSIVGPIIVEEDALVETMHIRDSIVQNPAFHVETLRSRNGEVRLARTTVLGEADVRRLDASECILRGLFHVADTQHGCVRFSAWTTGSGLPRKYESVELARDAELFTTVDFPQPGYGQLLESVGGAIREGAENGSEMGAFARERTSLKHRSLLVKLQEYMPLGLEPVIVSVT